MCSPSSSFSPLGISSSLLGRSLPFSSRQKAFWVDSLWTLDNARHNDPLRMQMSENSAETNFSSREMDWRCISQLFRNLRSLSFFKTSSYCPVLRNWRCRLVHWNAINSSSIHSSHRKTVFVPWILGQMMRILKCFWRAQLYKSGQYEEVICKWRFQNVVYFRPVRRTIDAFQWIYLFHCVIHLNF